MGTATIMDEPAAAPAAASTSTGASTSSAISLTSTSAKGRTRTWPAQLLLPYDGPPPSSANGSSSTELEPSATELQAAFSSQVRAREQLVDRPLLTSNLRERDTQAKREERVKRWPNTRIRIRFADRSQLEGTFSSTTDSIASVYDFVRLALAPSLREAPFILYQTPPRQLFARNDPALSGKALIDLGFAPAMSFYIKFDDESLNGRRPELIDELVKSATELPGPKPQEEGAKPGGQPLSKQAGFGGQHGKVTPKWLKIGKK